MVHKKVKLAYINNEVTRKSTFRKRKNGLIKKVSELSTLCGIKACVILYNNFDSEPYVWPSTDAVNQVLGRFRNMPDHESELGKLRMDQEGFLKLRIEKANQKLKKQCSANKELEMTKVMLENPTGESTVQDLMNTEYYVRM